MRRCLKSFGTTGKLYLEPQEIDCQQEQNYSVVKSWSTGNFGGEHESVLFCHIHKVKVITQSPGLCTEYLSVRVNKEQIRLGIG